MKNSFPAVGKIIDKSKIEYKLKMISKINSAASLGDTKALQWVIENGALFTEDFGKKKTPVQANPLADALKFIQNTSSSPVKKPSLIQTNA